MIGKPLSETVAVTSRGIEQQHTVVTGITHGSIVSQTVGKWWHQVVVTRHNDTGRRCDMTLNGIVGRELTHDLRILLVLAQEIAARPYMRHLLIHRNNGIEENGEVGTYVILGVCGDDGCQMSTS